MCFHTREEFDAYVASLKKSKGRARAAKGREEKSAKKYGLIILRDDKGEWVAGWHCDPTDAQDVANTIQDLKSWHAGEFRFVDTKNVDEERLKLKLKPLDQDGLPIPDRLPRASVDELAEEWDVNNKSSMPAGELGRIARSVQRQRAAVEERKLLEAEAVRLGVTVEELVAAR